MAKRHKITGRLRVGLNRLFRPGTTPGTLVADPQAPPPELRLCVYGPEGVEEWDVNDLTKIAEARSREGILWLDVNGLGDVSVIETVGELFGLHALALEDVLNTHQRPKVENYGDTLFLVFRAYQRDEPFSGEQVSVFVGDGHIISFQESGAHDCFGPVRERIRHGRGRIRRMGPDYLAYALIDVALDEYFPALETVGDRLEALEAAVFTSSKGSARAIESLLELRWGLLAIRRNIWPLRDVTRLLKHEETHHFGEDMNVFLRDLEDHVALAVDHVETYREMAGSLMDGYISMASHRMNEVMKVLTMIATVFIPLGFVAGLYGMNFDPDASPWNMPELGWAFGYPAVLIFMATISFAMLYLFKRKGWFGS